MGRIGILAATGWRWVSNISTAQWVAQLCGVSLTGGVAFAAGQPLWLVVFVGLGAFAFVSIIWSRLFKSPQSKTTNDGSAGLPAARPLNSPHDPARAAWNPEAITIGVGSVTLNPKPDMPLTGVLVKVYKALGGAPVKQAEKSAFRHKVDLAIMDKLVQYDCHVWARVGKRALQPLEADEIARGILDHSQNELHVDAAYSKIVYSDLHFCSMEIRRCWPDA